MGRSRRGGGRRRGGRRRRRGGRRIAPGSSPRIDGGRRKGPTTRILGCSRRVRDGDTLGSRSRIHAGSPRSQPQRSLPRYRRQRTLRREQLRRCRTQGGVRFVQVERPRHRVALLYDELYHRGGLLLRVVLVKGQRVIDVFRSQRSRQPWRGQLIRQDRDYLVFLTQPPL